MNVTPELSRPLAVDKIPANGLIQTITASPAERKALATRFDLIDLPQLQAEITVKRAKLDGSYAVTGSLTAEVVQTCVVTLEPLAGTIDHPIDLRFAPIRPDGIDTEDSDSEPIIDGIIDLGELVAQYLGLALDPYPRKPGLEFTAIEIAGDKQTPPPENPFAKLVEFPKKPKK